MGILENRVAIVIGASSGVGYLLSDLSKNNVPMCICNPLSVYYQVLPKEIKNIQSKKVHNN